MKKVNLLFVLGITLALGACGGGSNSSGNINGNWSAKLMDANNTNNTDFAFATMFTQTSGSNVNVVNFSFTTEDSCFGTGGTEAGSFGFAGDFNGNVTGTFAMNIQSGTPSGNTLTLNGTVNNNQIVGTWTLTGSSGCTGNGAFTMSKM